MRTNTVVNLAGRNVAPKEPRIYNAPVNSGTHMSILTRQESLKTPARPMVSDPPTPLVPQTPQSNLAAGGLSEQSSQQLGRASAEAPVTGLTGVSENFSVRESKRFHLWQIAKMTLYYRIYEATV